MARYNHYFPAFTNGEINPQMAGRSDLPLFNTAAQTIDNFIVQIQGGVTRRPGFVFGNDAKAATTTRLIPFFHSSGASYALEFSNNAFRIWKNGVRQGAPTTVTTTYTTSQIPELDYEQSGDELYITHKSHKVRVITRTSDVSWSINDVDWVCPPMYPLDDDTYGRTEDLGNTGVQVSSLSANTLGGSATLVMSGALFASSDVGKFIRIKNFTSDPDSEANATISTTQVTTDVLIQDGAIATAVNNDGATYNQIPHLYVSLPATTTSTRTTPYSTIVTTTTRTHGGSSNLTTIYKDTEASSIANTYTGSVQTAETVTVTGNETESWGLLEITGYTSSTTVTVEVKRPLSSTNFHSSQQWQMSRFGGSTNNPKKIAFHEGRMFLGNIGNDTNVLVASKTNKILDFENGEGDEGTLTAATALDYTLSEVGAIQWVHSAQRLIIGASNAVYSLTGGNNTGITPLTAPLFRKIAGVKCSEIKPLMLQGTTFFTYDSSKRLGALIFRQGDYSGFDFIDMTKFSDHLTTNGIDEMTVAGDVLWMISNNGLLGFTYNNELGVTAWHQHTQSDTCNSIFNVGDYLYLAITRTNGQYIEYMSNNIQDLAKEDVICVDSAVTYDSTATTTITGLSHLEGETVDVLADGAAHPQEVVSGGQITLDAAASTVQVGLPYTATLRSNELIGGNRKGTHEGRKTRVVEAGLKVLNTNGCFLQYKGYEPQTGEALTSEQDELLFNTGQVYGEGPALLTAPKLKKLNSGYMINPSVEITSSGALPVSILSISVDAEVED